MESKLNLPEPEIKPKREAHPILAFPLVKNLVCQLQPELLQTDLFNCKTLDDLENYLLSDDPLASDALQEAISEDFFVVLLGMKTLLTYEVNNIPDLSRHLSDRKRQMGLRLQVQINESTQKTVKEFG